jgi:ABC-2 type transport system permease protein
MTPPQVRQDSLRLQIATWITIFRIALEERLVYRGDFALGTLMRFLPIITQIFLWWAIFDSVNTGSVATTSLVGYSFPDMVAYYLLTMLARAFSSMPGLASTIARQIRDGEIKKFLIQPVDMLGFLFLGRVAHKVAYYSVAFLPFAFVFFLCRGYFENGWPSAINLFAFFLSILMSFALGFFLEASLGLIGFWFLEVSALLFVYMLFSFFLSGHMFPLDMLPPSWSLVVDFLPFKYLAYFPAVVFLEKVQGTELAIDLAVEAAWVVFFVLLSRWLYARGVRHYSGYGG